MPMAAFEGVFGLLILQPKGRYLGPGDVLACAIVGRLLRAIGVHFSRQRGKVLQELIGFRRISLKARNAETANTSKTL